MKAKALTKVSIPFKREGAFKAPIPIDYIVRKYMFQFPSSGKGRSKDD